MIVTHDETWSGNTLKTGNQGAKFEVQKTHTLIEVAPHSEVKVLTSERPEAIELLSGMARAHVQKAIANTSKEKVKFTLKSKSATMGVRGTDFLGIVTPILGESEIIVFEGNVDFTSVTDTTDKKNVPAGHWGGIGGRFGARTHDLIALPQPTLDYFNSASTVQ